ncbi:hypothetical protein MKW98_031088 [Papaver atlanticum]|uniref:ATP-dependent DNA helicase n=1 Tax=Papaver atlanticum TaxID=357466 RepID=A0AAD4SWP8_9MAGN|nr:hypothetical protein MKW98_031088 [Papaver atlanticum]
MTDHEKQTLKERCRAAYQNRKTRVNVAGSNVQVSTSAGEHKAESSYVPRRSPRIKLQQRELQLEKLCITKRDRRSSLTENQKEEVLEKRRRAYEIRRARVREATNNEHRAGPSSAAFLPRRSPIFTEQTQCQDEHAAEASRKRKGKSVVIYEKRRRPNNDIPDGEQQLVDSGVPHQIGKENINIQVGPISGNDGTGKETTKQTATSVETGTALSKDSSEDDFRKRLFQIEEDRAARRVRNRMNRYLRLQESLLTRSRSSRIEQARLIRENLSCDGLVYVPVHADIPLTFASSELGGFFDLPGATSSRGIKRLSASVTSDATLFLHDVQLTYPPSRPHTACQRRYRASGTMHQRISSPAIVPSNGQRFRRVVDEIKWVSCVGCKTKVLDISTEGIYLEKILIARVHPVMSVYRVKGQQYKYGGNVINFVQDVSSIAKVLPCKPEDLSAILVVKRTGIVSTKEFIVRREYVRQSLNWLKAYHKYYKDIEISDENIASLPEEGVPLDHLVMDGGTIGVNVQPDQERGIRRALEEKEGAEKTNVELPFSGQVIDEFTTQGYITMAFPALFPRGEADLREPRIRKVPARLYFQYLMSYYDQRFAQDSRFRYFSWNSLTRWRALALETIYINRNPRDSSLACRVAYCAQQMRGCRAYWYSRLKELISMVNQLGPPTIFFTLSAADLQWPELYKLLDTENRLESLDPNRRMRERAKLLNQNPLVVSWFLQKRVDLFLKLFLKKEFKVVDHWYRFEWQSRGSGHMHGFLWLEDRPDPSRIATDEEVRCMICDYFDSIICTWNPDPSFRCGSYCLRKSKVTRNDQWLNSHNRAVLQAWSANIDWSAVTTTESVTRYIAKYAAKEEPASKNYIDILRGIIDNPLRPCRDSESAVKRMLIKNASERDESAQEVCHLLMGWNISDSSRKFVTLNLSESRLFSSQLRKRKNRSNEDVEQGRADPNFFSRYLSRPDDYNSRSKSFEEAKRNFLTWSGRYAELIRPTENPSVDVGIVEDEFEDETHTEDERLDEWMQASAMALNFRTLEATDLGLRDIDKNHFWSSGLLDNPTIHEKIGFVNTLRQAVKVTHDSGLSTSLSALSRQQQAAHGLILDSLRSNSTIRLIISGGAGTGKSTLINAIVRSTRELFSNDNSVRIMAPTGVAAFNIGGSTIHHELGITADKS